MKISTSSNIKVGTVISLIAMLATLLISFFFTPFILSKVGDRNYGIYEFAISITSWATFALGAVASSFNRFSSREDESDKTGVSSSKLNTVYLIMFAMWAFVCFVGLGVFLIISINTDLLFTEYSANEKNLLLLLIFISMMQVLAMTVMRIFNLYIGHNNKYIYLRLSSLLINVASYLLTIPFLLNGHGLITMMIVFASVNILGLIVDALYAFLNLKMRFKKVRLNEFKSSFKPIFVFSSIIMVSEICTKINAYLDVSVLGFVGYAEEITLYKLPMQLLAGLSTANYAIFTSFNAKINEYEAKNLPNKNIEIFENVSFCQILIWLVVFGGFISCGKEFVIQWVGVERIAVYYIGIALLLVYSVVETMLISSEIARARNLHTKRILIQFLSMVINAALTIALVLLLPREYCLVACISATAFSIIVGLWVVLSVFNSKEVKLPMKRFWCNYIFVLCGVVIAAAISIGIGFVLPSTIPNILLLFIKGLIFLAISVPLIFLFRRKQIQVLKHFILRK